MTPPLWVLSSNAKRIVRAIDITDIWMRPLTEAGAHSLVVTTRSGGEHALAEIGPPSFVEKVPMTLAAAIADYSTDGGVLACSDFAPEEEVDHLFEHLTMPFGLKEVGHILAVRAAG